jgi:hypothetical protein
VNGADVMMPSTRPCERLVIAWVVVPVCTMLTPWTLCIFTIACSVK